MKIDNNLNNNGSKFYPAGINKPQAIICGNNSNANNFDGIGRKKESTPPAKPPPPTLPKPKFILPQSSANSLILQRNLRAKSELNIAEESLNNNSSVSSNNLPVKTVPPASEEIVHASHFNKSVNQPQASLTKVNNSLVSSSQGYQSDTWDSHSSRQSYDTDSNRPHPASRYKHFNKMTSKLAAESKLAKNSLLSNTVSNNGSTSDGSITGSGTDDTDSLPNCINMDDQQSSQQFLHKNILIEKPTSSTSSTVSTSSNCCGSNSSSSSSSSSSSASSAPAMSNATTLSSHSSNSFSAAVASAIQQLFTCN